MRISDWSSDVCSSDLQAGLDQATAKLRAADLHADLGQHSLGLVDDPADELRGQDLESRAHHAAMVRPIDPGHRPVACDDRKRVVLGKSVSVLFDLGGRRNIKKTLSNPTHFKHK